MTAYAAAESASDAFSVSIEIRSYNSRHLDTVLRMPSGYLSLEEKLKELVSVRVIRGRIEIKINIENETAISVETDKGDIYDSDYIISNIDSYITMMNLCKDSGFSKLKR